MLDIKANFFGLLESRLDDVELADNRSEEMSFPYCLLTTTSLTIEPLKNSYKQTCNLVLHVFSSYDGEKEIHAIYQRVANAVEEFTKTHEEIVSRASQEQIIDDDSTGPVKKHGIIRIQFKTLEVEA